MTFNPHHWQTIGKPYSVEVWSNRKVKGYVTRQNVICPCGLEGFRRGPSPVVYVCDETLDGIGGCARASPSSE